MWQYQVEILNMLSIMKLCHLRYYLWCEWPYLVTFLPHVIFFWYCFWALILYFNLSLSLSLSPPPPPPPLPLWGHNKLYNYVPTCGIMSSMPLFQLPPLEYRRVSICQLYIPVRGTYNQYVFWLPLPPHIMLSHLTLSPACMYSAYAEFVDLSTSWLAGPPLSSGWLYSALVTF